MTINSLFPNSCGLWLQCKCKQSTFWKVRESLQRNGGQAKLKLPKGCPNDGFTPTIILLEREFSKTTQYADKCPFEARLKS